MTIKKLKVRPKKIPPPNPCAVELAAMLGCWASTKDILNSDPERCAGAAHALHDCMRNAPLQRRAQAPTINYHLSRLSKLAK